MQCGSPQEAFKMKEEILDFSINNLGERRIPAPLTVGYFKSDDECILYKTSLKDFNFFKTIDGRLTCLEVAGPREKIFFDPPKVKAAIVTCGGLCPGINDVIRALVMELYYRYGVRNVIGIRYGFQGLIPRYGHDVTELNPEVVKDIHTFGGSILSSSRGNQDIGAMVDAIERMNISILFCIGGDGTMRGAELITDEILRRQKNISVIGIPKTIDNDLMVIEKSFGFDTAIQEAVKAIQCAHVEAKGAPYGIGLVKLMGRQSGHIAASAALAQADANFVLIPEIPFDLEGEKGFLKVLENRLKVRCHALILVAEGAGQDLIRRDGVPIETDASGNIKLSEIGLFLKEKIEAYFNSIHMEINLKYIDPSYIVRSVTANASDSLYCGILAKYAVHAGMAGKTGMVVGLVNDTYVHLPLKAVASKRKLVDPHGNIWMNVLESTGQPVSMKNE
jgi:6-phosphofructokinase 1